MIDARSIKCEFAVGIYQYNKDYLTHALTKNLESGPYDAPLKTVCGSFADIQYSDPRSKPMKVSNITCKKCLKIMAVKRLLLEKDSPVNRVNRKVEKPASKKFFLVKYQDATMSTFSGLAELKENLKRHMSSVTDIWLIDKYRLIDVEEVLLITDKSGKEITEEDL